MTFPRARLAVSACLFLAWLGFLFFLVLESWQTVVLSRPQLLVSNLTVLAEVADKDGRPDAHVTVTRVVWAEDREDFGLVGQKVVVPNLLDVGPAQGYRGPGSYILPLSKDRVAGAPLYLVAAVPLTPGYVPAQVHVELLDPGPKPDQAARFVAEFAEVPETEASKLLQRAPALVKKNVPSARAFEFEKQMRDVGAHVRSRPNDVRIYPATPRTLGQLEEIAAAKGG